MPDAPVIPKVSPRGSATGQPAGGVTGGAGQLPPLLEEPDLFVDSSRCWAPAGWLRWAMPGIVAVLVLNAFLALRSTGANLAQYLTTMLLWAGCGFAVVLALRAQFRARVRERRAVEVAAEMIQRRRWSAAGVVLESVLARPMRAEPVRVRALTLLSMLLMRYERGEAALSVQEDLLSEDLADGLMVLTVKLSRAAALLREDRLFDADRAIADLRRGVARLRRFVADRAEDLARARAAGTGNEPGPEQNAAASAAPGDEPQTDDDDEPLPDLAEEAQETIMSPSDDQDVVAQATAALALIEMYRDVKTGHPADAIDAYRAKLPALRDALGHRVADVHALAARALDLLNKPDEAAAAYERATLLAPAVELHYRYIELDPLLGRYKPAAAPPAIMEVAPVAVPPGVLPGSVLGASSAGESAAAPAQGAGREEKSGAQPGVVDTATAIRLLRQGILLGRLCLFGLFAMATALTVFGDAAPRWLGYRPDLSGILILLLAAWVLFIALQRRSARMAAIVNGLIAAGAAGAAEAQIALVLRKPLMFGGARAVAIYQLTLLRQTQQRWSDVARLSAALLNYRRVGRGPVAVPLRLLLAASSLEQQGDLKTARAALSSLSTTPAGRPLSLAERLRVLGLQLDFHRRIQAWGAVISALPAKLELAELMPAGDAARAQATMAMAAQGLGLAEWHSWLLRRAELLADPARLCAAVPALSPLWAPRV